MIIKNNFCKVSYRPLKGKESKVIFLKIFSIGAVQTSEKLLIKKNQFNSLKSIRNKTPNFA